MWFGVALKSLARINETREWWTGKYNRDVQLIRMAAVEFGCNLESVCVHKMPIGPARADQGL